MGRAVASAPGKTILFGEHFVVAGEPAIAVAVGLRARVEAVAGGDEIYVVSRNLSAEARFPLEGGGEGPLLPVAVAAREALREAGANTGVHIVIDSEIPPAAGMGSSAAVAVATVAAVAAAAGSVLPAERVSELAYRAEEVVHGRPSGIDNTVSALGGAILYRRDAGARRLNVDFGGVRLVLADTGLPRSTGAMVRKVLALREAYPEILGHVYSAAGVLAKRAAELLEKGDYESVGRLMDVNQGLLAAIGVSTLEIEELVYAAREAGALGAKLTGAGGGGFVVALARSGDAERVAARLKEISGRVYTAPVETEGVRVEERDL